MAVVETRNLTKVFKEGELGAINKVSLATREGEFLVFLGPSGSGKTTLLRMIAGLETPTSGEILIGGQVVNHLTPRERRIAMVFQSYALYPHLSVYNNIAFPLKAQKVPREQHRGVVRQIGTQKDVCEDPADTFVATFLGSPPMNLVEFSDVIVGFRPESFLPADLLPGAKHVRFRYKVNYVEYLGAERVLYGAIEGRHFESKEIISRLSWTMPAGYDAGSVHDFSVAESDLRFFDRKTEKRADPRPYPWQ